MTAGLLGRVGCGVAELVHLPGPIPQRKIGHIEWTLTKGIQMVLAVECSVKAPVVVRRSHGAARSPARRLSAGPWGGWMDTCLLSGR